MGLKHGQSQMLSLDGWMPSTLGIFVKFFASRTSDTTNVTVRETTGCSSISLLNFRSRLRFFGHVTRRTTRDLYHSLSRTAVQLEKTTCHVGSLHAWLERGVLILMFSQPTLTNIQRGRISKNEEGRRSCFWRLIADEHANKEKESQN